MMNGYMKSLALAILLMLIAGIALSQEKPSFEVNGIVRDGTGAPV